MKKNIFCLLIVSSCLQACDKEQLSWNLERNNQNDGQKTSVNGSQIPNKSAPKVNIGVVTNIKEYSSNVSGEITEIGSTEIISYGHCWSITPLPTITNQKTNLGKTNSLGIFSSSIMNLSPNTTYYVRAYATNSYGTSYGNQISFKTNASLCSSINCESLTGFNTYVDKISTSSSANWNLGPGYKGNGFNLTQSNYGGYIEFKSNLSKTSKMTFWTKSVNPGYPNRTPDVTINGIRINTTIIDGSTSNSNYMKLETINILPGNNTIRIEFSRVSTYFSYYIDEIEFWCQ